MAARSAEDPLAVLGLPPGATADEIAARYRRLALRWHPDRNARGRPEEAARRMARINAAYAELRGREGRDEDVVAEATPAPRRPPGWWLDAPTRERLGPELTAVLHGREAVELVVCAATWAGAAVVAVTDRRLLWLHDDAVTGRVRAVRWLDVVSVDVRPGRLRRTVAAVRVRTRRGRAVAFGELAPPTAANLAERIRARSRG